MDAPPVMVLHTALECDVAPAVRCVAAEALCDLALMRCAKDGECKRQTILITVLGDSAAMERGGSVVGVLRRKRGYAGSDSVFGLSLSRCRAALQYELLQFHAPVRLSWDL